MNIYYPGQNVRYSATCMVCGALADPTTLTLTLQAPSGAQSVLSSPTWDSTGTYHYDYTIPNNAETGFWQYWWTSTGAQPVQNGLSLRSTFVVAEMT